MKRVLSGFLFFVIAGGASAQGAGGYSFLRVGYTQETLKGNDALEDVTFSGKAIDLSIVLTEQLALIASQYDADPDNQMLRFVPSNGLYLPLRKIPQESSAFGLMFHSPIGREADLLVSYEKGQRKSWFMDSSGPLLRNGSEDGKRISVGLQTKFFGQLEARFLRQKFEYEDSVENRDDKIRDDVIEGHYYFTPRYSVGLSFIRNDYSERYVVSVGAAY